MLLTACGLIFDESIAKICTDHLKKAKTLRYSHNLFLKVEVKLMFTWLKLMFNYHVYCLMVVVRKVL